MKEPTKAATPSALEPTTTEEELERCEALRVEEVAEQDPVYRALQRVHEQMGFKFTDHLETLILDRIMAEQRRMLDRLYIGWVLEDGQLAPEFRTTRRTSFRPNLSWTTSKDGWAEGSVA